MKVIASNDSIEFLELTHTDVERPRFLTHNRHQLDQRADWTLRLLSSWGMAASMGDLMRQYCDDEHKKNLPTEQVPPQELIMRICEVVDAAWNEMQHRGWIVNTGSIGEK